ncbi:MAG TPA: SurA N-terminal domain-containing protein [Pyrinomonadaceae bacterium]|nr:SurA N-terminal domain-containing protein [Pyrinomonadaceae bacterium]
MQSNHKVIISIAVLAVSALIFSACGGPATNSSSGGAVDPNETAAKVNGKIIKMEEVHRAVKQQAQGQDDKMSPLELAGARLQVLQSLIEQEVMFQKAEKEGIVISDGDVTTELNKRKTQSGKSADQIAKEMKESGVTEESVRESLRKELAIQKLVEQVTGKIEPPKDSEIEAFYNGNKEAFVKKKGVKLAAIVVDPAKTSEADTTVDEPSAVLAANEIIKQLQQGVDFAQVAREKSEDQSRFQNGDLGYIAEEELKQSFPEQVGSALMNPEFQIGRIITAQMQGKYFVLKLQERSDKDEALTLESPGVRQQVTDSLINSRKQLLAASYQAIAMNEAKIENFLAQKVVANPNELSGARPAGASMPAAANTNTNANANTAPAGNANSNSNVAPANANTRPAANTNAASNANRRPIANANR